MRSLGSTLRAETKVANSDSMSEESEQSEQSEQSEEPVNSQPKTCPYLRIVGRKLRPLVRSILSPSSPSSSPTTSGQGVPRAERNAAWKTWATSLHRFTDIKKGMFDCGCDLHSEGCFRWLTKTISVDDLSELCGMQFADKKKAFQELRTMLHNSATLMPDTDNTYELHYKLLGIHEVCRPAFLWASGWSCCWS